MKMGFMRKTRGAISIFLVIILLPMMTMAGVFLDASRVKLAQEVVATSGDLALNTVLSNYDKNLKDYFGLLASCQNNNDVIAVSKQYFVDSMISAGVSMSAAQEYADNVMDAFIGDEDVADMLQISVEGDVTIQPTANGAMNNPALIKKGIIEFMKYRTPVNGAVDLFKKIADSGASKQVENASLEAKMTDARKKFYEAEEKLIEQAEKAYKAIKKYNNYETKSGVKISNEDYLHDFSKFLNPEDSSKTLEALFKSGHEKLVKNLYNTHNTEGTTTKNLMTRRYISEPSVTATYSNSKKATAANIETLLKEFNTALKQYNSAASDLNTAWDTVGRKLSSDYGIQYWVALTKTCSTKYSTYDTKAEALWKAAKKLQNAIDNPADDAMETKIKKSDVSNNKVTYDTTDEDGKLTLESLCDSFFNYYDNNVKSSVTGGGSSAFRNIGDAIDSVNTTSNNEKLELGTVDYIYNTRNKLNNYKTDFKASYDLAKDAKDQTNKLKKLLDDYVDAFDAWDMAASKLDPETSQLAASNKDEIQDLKDAGIELFSKDSVIAAVDRLDNIYTAQKKFHDDIKAIKYKSTSVTDITKYTKFRSAAALNESKIVRTESSLNSYVNESFSFTMKAELQRIEIWDNRTSDNLVVDGAYVITDSFHFDIEKTYLELYDWMKAKFDGVRSGPSASSTLTGTVSDENSADNAKGAITDASEDTSDVNTEENTKGHNFSEWKDLGAATLPSKDKNAPEEKGLGAKLTETSDYVYNLFSNFPETFTGSLVNMRDDLYTLDYIFSMFTYDTFDNEGYYSVLTDQEKKDLKASTATTKYETDTVKNKWKESPDRKTLTLTPRDASNNWAYGGEVEYILYGNGSNALNKSSAYASIYAIRYVFDLPAVFNVYWTNRPLNLLANALQTFAYIPAPLTKTLACLAITAAEAAVDVNQIRLGMPVMLIKIEEDDLVCNYQSVFNGEEESPTDVTDKITLQYSDYLKLFLYIKLIGSGEEQIYIRTADVIQANMYQVTKNKEYSLGKAQVYYDLKATAMVAPMWTRLLAIDDLGDVTTQNAWRTITIDMTRGY